ncbi:MAG TPA: hypothetical protein VFO38_05665 [Candidatus Saccharimonadales bacterium]|nr:hypothetical protein [Candidatus Saccharimonadales bacterium]
MDQLDLDFRKRIALPVRNFSLLNLLEFPDILHVVRRWDPRTGQRLLRLGSVHDPDPERWYYAVGRSLLKTWLAETEGQKRLICVEGQQLHRPLFSATEEDSIRECHSELGLLNFWGNQYGIRVVPTEPPNFRDLVTLLLMAREGTTFSGKDVLFYIGVREIPIYYRMGNPTESLESWMQETLNTCRRQMESWCQPGLPFVCDLNYPIFRELHWEQLGFYPTDDPDFVDPKSGLKVKDLYLKITTAFTRADEPVTAITQVSRSCLNLRDSHKALQLWKLWQAGYSLLGWEGIIHTMGAETVYKELGEPQDLGQLRKAYVAMSSPDFGHLVAPKGRALPLATLKLFR